MLRRSLFPRFFSIIREKMERDSAEEAEALEAKRKAYEEKLQVKAVDDALNMNGDGSAASSPREARAGVAPRSSLFVPCSNVKAMSKIPQLEADVFILDLEDSVAIKDKEAARNNLLEFVNAGYEDGSLLNKRLIVRVNSPTYSPDTMRYGLPDVDAVAVLGDRIEGMAIPKTSIKDEAFLRDVVHPNHHLWAFFETPQSIVDVDQILSTKFYDVAAMGLNDLSMELQLPLNYHMSTGSGAGKASKDMLEAKRNADVSSRNPMMSRRMPLFFHMMKVINAARANNVHPIDGVFNDPTDSLGFMAELNEAKGFGFSGKTLIHPNQIKATHEVYSATAEEIEWARRVLTVLHQSEGGVAVLDGKMIEELHGRMAKRILAYAPAE